MQKKKSAHVKESTEKNAKKSIKKPLIIFSVILLLIAAFIAGGFAVTGSDTNLPNVFVGDIDVGGLTQTQTEDKLVSQGWEKKTSEKTVLTTFGGIQEEIDPVESGAVLTVEKATECAYSYGHSGNIVNNMMTYIKNLFKTADVNDIYAEISESYLDSIVQDTSENVENYLGTDVYTVDLEGSCLTVKKGTNELTINTENLKSEIRAALKESKTEFTFLELDKELTCPDFDAILKELEREPENATYTDDNKFDVIDEIVGCKFDVATAQKMWQDALPGEEIKIPVEVTWPEVTGEELRGRLFHDLLGAMTTEFPASAADRVSNVNLCASKIDGTILYPGDTFSYNDTVGPRTEEAGFKAAPAYVDGEVKEEIGGGACQVSSTLYASTLFAFLETVDRTCHQFKVSYMQMGTDATVAWPEDGNIVDFKFKNNKNYPVKIVAKCDTENKNITVEIWGTLEDDDYMPVEFDNRYTWVNTYDRVIEPAYEGREGYTIKLSTENDIYTITDEETGDPIGIRTLTKRMVLDSSGNLVEEEYVNPYVENIKGYGMDTYYTHP